MLNYYSILEIDSSATLEDIRKAYYRLAQVYHPDKSPADGGEYFKKVHEAYTQLCVLKKEKINKSFDHLFTDTFNHLFHHFSNDKKRIIRVSLSLSEAYSGVVKILSLFVYDTCPACSGKGCQDCGKMGALKKEKNIEFSFPRGTYHGEIFVLKKFYNNIDYHLKVSVENISPFSISKNGRDIILNENVNIFKLLLGGEYAIRLPDGGEDMIDISNKTINNVTVTIPNKGLSGDLVVILKPHLPNVLKDSDLELIKDLYISTSGGKTDDKA